MNQNTTKWIGFVQGLFYPIVSLVIAALVQALGAGGALNGTLPIGVGVLIAGILSVIENQMQKNGYTALFGFARQ